MHGTSTLLYSYSQSCTFSPSSFYIVSNQKVDGIWGYILHKSKSELPDLNVQNNNICSILLCQIESNNLSPAKLQPVVKKKWYVDKFLGLAHTLVNSNVQTINFV